jgi:hypothetical protein
MLCPNVFCGLVTLLELAWGGTPDAAVLVFAMSRSACRILDVSGAVVAGGFPGCSLTEMKSFGGVPSGVVDFNALAFGAFNFSLNWSSIVAGKVLPRSQISTSFLILTYYAEEYVSSSSR